MQSKLLGYSEMEAQQSPVLTNLGVYILNLFNGNYCLCACLLFIFYFFIFLWFGLFSWTSLLELKGRMGSS